MVLSEQDYETDSNKLCIFVLETSTLKDGQTEYSSHSGQN